MVNLFRNKILGPFDYTRPKDCTATVSCTAHKGVSVEWHCVTRNAITKARKSENTKKTESQTAGFSLDGFFRAFVFSCFRDGISRIEQEKRREQLRRAVLLGRIPSAARLNDAG
jgi:hypothetical protein